MPLPSRAWAVRPVARARRLRPRLRRRPAAASHARGRRDGHRDPPPPGPPRRGGLRSVHERRRGHPPPHPPRPLRARRSAARGIELPHAGDYGVAQCFLSRDAEARAARDARRSRTPSATTTRRSSAGATCPSTRAVLGPVARESMPVLRQLFIGRMCPVAGVRAHALHDPQARRPPRDARRGSTGFYIASLSSRTVVYKGLALPERLDALLPRPPRRGDAEQARPRPLALQHEHVPHLGARAPVPAHRAQRRDQHAARQPDVDGARASRCSRARRSASTSPTSSRSSARAAATRRRSTTSSTSSSRAGAACRT